MTQLVLENGAFQPPKGFVLLGFYVDMSLRLEDCALDRAPVQGGDRFFNGISFVSISDRFLDRSRFLSEKASKKVSNIQNLQSKPSCGSRTALSVVIPCSAEIVFAMQFFRLDCGSPSTPSIKT